MQDIDLWYKGNRVKWQSWYRYTSNIYRWCVLKVQSNAYKTLWKQSWVHNMLTKTTLHEKDTLRLHFLDINKSSNSVRLCLEACTMRLHRLYQNRLGTQISYHGHQHNRRRAEVLTVKASFQLWFGHVSVAYCFSRVPLNVLSWKWVDES